ncbi:MAG: TetR/AcrR family transcriptional regulator [Desulfatibacillaceae bacterium]|nr:TetR/AcrR family transcriptional regulator [Desulfatibacillaceae bacterium]
MSPAPARSAEEVQAFREKILDAAQDILNKQGFEALSMRRIAGRLNMTATNIYNYFVNKDEIYLALQTRGFIVLVKHFELVDAQYKSPEDRLKGYMRAYIAFGLEQPDQYAVMFTYNTPKFADYVGTPQEPAATEEKLAAMVLADMAAKTAGDYLKERPDLAGITDPYYRMVHAWVTLHGIVSIMNSRVLQEVVVNSDEVISFITDEVLSHLLSPSVKGAKAVPVPPPGKPRLPGQ